MQNIDLNVTYQEEFWRDRADYPSYIQHKIEQNGEDVVYIYTDDWGHSTTKKGKILAVWPHIGLVEVQFENHSLIEYFDLKSKKWLERIERFVVALPIIESIENEEFWLKTTQVFVQMAAIMEPDLPPARIPPLEAFKRLTYEKVSIYLEKTLRFSEHFRFQYKKMFETAAPVGINVQSLNGFMVKYEIYTTPAKDVQSFAEIVFRGNFSAGLQAIEEAATLFKQSFS